MISRVSFKAQLIVSMSQLRYSLKAIILMRCTVLCFQFLGMMTNMSRIQACVLLGNLLSKKKERNLAQRSIRKKETIYFTPHFWKPTS